MAARSPALSSSATATSRFASPTSLPVSEKSTRFVKLTNLDLRKAPTPDEKNPASCDRQITLGDLHGNPIKLLEALIEQNILQFPSGVYEELVGIVYKDWSLSQLLELKRQEAAARESKEPERADNIAAKIAAIKQVKKGDLARYTTLLETLEFKSNGESLPFALIRLIGDILADRGPNDILTLILLDVLQKKLKAKGLSDIEIFRKMPMLFSNHDAEFWRGYLSAFTAKLDIPKPETRSYHNLTALIEEKIVTKITLDRLVKDVYAPCLKLMDYSIDYSNPQEPVFTFYTHAPVGLKTIITRAAEYYDLKCDKSVFSSIEKLSELIDRINHAFIRDIPSTLTEEEDFCEGRYNAAFLFKSLTWNRDDVRCFNGEPSHIGKYKIRNVFGHVGARVRQEAERYNTDEINRRGATDILLLSFTDNFCSPSQLMISHDYTSSYQYELLGKTELKVEEKTIEIEAKTEEKTEKKEEDDAHRGKLLADIIKKLDELIGSYPTNDCYRACKLYFRNCVEKTAVICQIWDDFSEFNDMALNFNSSNCTDTLSSIVKEGFAIYKAIFTPEEGTVANYKYNTIENRKNVLALFISKLSALSVDQKESKEEKTVLALKGIFKAMTVNANKKRVTDCKREAAAELARCQENYRIYRLLLPEMSQALQAYDNFYEQQLSWTRVSEIKDPDKNKIYETIKERLIDFIEFHRIAKHTLKEIENNISDPCFTTFRMALAEGYKTFTAMLKGERAYDPKLIFDKFYHIISIFAHAPLPNGLKELVDKERVFGKHSEKSPVIATRSSLRK